MALLEEVIMTVQGEWGATIVGIVTDASGECQKAWQLLGHKYPHIVVLDYYGHQVWNIDSDPATYLQYA